jgi:ATP adenylyltransferase
MKRLWSPWRSLYIQSFRTPAGKKKRGSIFTQALRAGDDRKNLILWRGEHCFVIMNRFPYNSGHVMVVPNREVADVKKLTPEELGEIMATVQRVIAAIDGEMGPQGYNFGANFGRVSGAGIDEHVHFHIVPRWNGDTNFMPVLADTKVISDDMAKTWKSLRKRLQNGAKSR